MPNNSRYNPLETPQDIHGRSFWPLVEGHSEEGHPYAVSNRFPQVFGGADGAAFDGWVGTDRVVEPGTVTTDTWTMIIAPQGLPSELYNIAEDPDQKHNIIDDYPEVADQLRTTWLSFLESHGASEERLRPFIEGHVTPPAVVKGTIYAFRDDLGQLIGFQTEGEATKAAFLENAPGPRRDILAMSFDKFLADNPKNLIHLFDQYYWADDLI